MKYSLLIILSAVLTLTACSKDKSGTPPKSEVARYKWTPLEDEDDGDVNIPKAATISVFNNFGEPIAGAEILIGTSVGNPFANNYVKTDSSGMVLLPGSWKVATPVTVEAAGYTRLTLMNQKPGNMIIRLSKAQQAPRVEVKGQITDLPIVNGDGLIDFAIAMPALTRADLLNFDLGYVISPYTDTIKAAGQTGELPSNVSIPKQKENYSIVSVTLDKPIYRLKFPTLGAKKLVNTRGRFVFKNVVKDLNDKKPFYEIINHFTILGGGAKDLTLTEAISGIDFSGTQYEFSQSIDVTNAAVADDEVQLVISAVDMNGSLLPTDVKKVNSAEPLKLQTLAGNDKKFIVNVLKKKNEFMKAGSGTDRLSASMQPYTPAVASTYLPLISNPAINSNSGVVTISLPSLPTTAGINGIATTASISELVEEKDGNKTVIITVKRWEILSPGWSQEITLPNWPLSKTENKQRVEVNYVGSNTTNSTKIDDTLAKNATHVTHASTDF